MSDSKILFNAVNLKKAQGSRADGLDFRTETSLLLRAMGGTDAAISQEQFEANAEKFGITDTAKFQAFFANDGQLSKLELNSLINPSNNMAGISEAGLAKIIDGPVSEEALSAVQDETEKMKAEKAQSTAPLAKGSKLYVGNPAVREFLYADRKQQALTPGALAKMINTSLSGQDFKPGQSYTSQQYDAAFKAVGLEELTGKLSYDADGKLEFTALTKQVVQLARDHVSKQRSDLVVADLTDAQAMALAGLFGKTPKALPAAEANKGAASKRGPTRSSDTSPTKKQVKMVTRARETLKRSIRENFLLAPSGPDDRTLADNVYKASSSDASKIAKVLDYIPPYLGPISSAWHAYRYMTATGNYSKKS